MVDIPQTAFLADMKPYYGLPKPTNTPLARTLKISKQTPLQRYQQRQTVRQSTRQKSLRRMGNRRTRLGNSILGNTQRQIQSSRKNKS